MVSITITIVVVIVITAHYQRRAKMRLAAATEDTHCDVQRPSSTHDDMDGHGWTWMDMIKILYHYHYCKHVTLTTYYLPTHLKGCSNQRLVVIIKSVGHLLTSVAIIDDVIHWRSNHQ